MNNGVDAATAETANVRSSLISAGENSVPGVKGFFHSVWDHWKKAAHAVGVVQTRLIMIAFYFVVVLPLGLMMKLGNDKLRLRRPNGSAWVPHEHQEPSLDSARRQF
ncbi:MAG: hypothetical protein HY270_22155 [Deltaproteobacteria bacterium]|nr:hypothetical protein [Deltaproteobacteria bacterium]